MNNMQTQNRPITRLPKRKRPPFTKTAVGALALASGGMLALALPNLLGGTGIAMILKTGLIAVTAGIVSYSVNRLAIERGAPLTAIGFSGAGAASIISMLLVGTGLFASTYSGLVLKDAAELQLQEHGSRMVSFIGYRNRMAVESGRAGPVIRVIVADLDKKAKCETRASCVSGKKQGGRGPVARVLEEKAGRARIIAGQLSAGEMARQAALKDLNRLIADYQKALGDAELDVWERRLALQKLDARIDQKLSALDEAIPVSLLLAYAKELGRAEMISGDPDTSMRLGMIFKTHGDTLEAVLETLKKGVSLKPAFPRRTGVADTFDYMGHFAPIAAITAVVELIFPLVLWLYTYLALYWRQYQIDPPRQKSAAKDDGFSGPFDPSNPPRPARKRQYRGTRPAQRNT